MAAPSRQFGKLSIDTQMATTRRQAQRRSAGNAPDRESSLTTADEDSSNDEQAAPSRPSQPQSQSFGSKGKQAARSASPTSSTEASPSPIMSRAHKTRDILSTFDEDVLPKEYRPDIFERINHVRKPEECVKQLDLEGTIFQLAVNDEAVYRSLCRAQPVEARAVGFYQKVRKRIRGTLEGFDRHARTGEPAGEGFSPRPSVHELGERLEYFGNLVKNEVRERGRHGAGRAAGCLIYLLHEVCKRNEDAFERAGWRRRAPAEEDENDRNLFQCLIGPASSGSGPFVLDGLFVVANEAELRSNSQRDELNEIRGLLHRHQAPSAYRRRFQELLDSLAAAGSPTAGPQPGQKRPGAGHGRGGQKRTK